MGFGRKSNYCFIAALYDCLVVVGDLPGAAHPPVGILRPAEVAVVNTTEDILIAVVGDGNLVGLIGLQIQLDGTVAPGLGEGVGAIGSSHGDLPGTVLAFRAGLAGFLTKPVRLGVGEGAFGLREGNRLGTGVEPIALGNNGDCLGTGAGTVGCCTCGENHTGEDGDDHEEHRESFLCH